MAEPTTDTSPSTAAAAAAAAAGAPDFAAASSRATRPRATSASAASDVDSIELEVEMVVRIVDTMCRIELDAFARALCATARAAFERATPEALNCAAARRRLRKGKVWVEGREVISCASRG